MPSRTSRNSSELHFSWCNCDAYFYGGSARANTLSDDQNAAKMEKLTSNLARATPMQKAGLPLDIATGALYLASDEGRFVNSHDLVIDGGRTSMFHEPQQ